MSDLVKLAEAVKEASRRDAEHPTLDEITPEAWAAFTAEARRAEAERDALQAENTAMRRQIEAGQMRRLAKGDALLADKSPHRCPVCEGRGQVLFNPDMPYGSSASAGPWLCRPCMGSGILWTVHFSDAALASEVKP